MKITDIRVHRSALGLTRPYTIAYRTVTETEICWVEVVADHGLVGLGAANPSPMVTGESLEDTETTLAREKGRYLGRSGMAIRDLSEDLLRHIPWPGARAALDIAFHDLYAQSLGMPLAALLGVCHREMPTSITIGIKGVAETIEEGEEYLGRGFRVLKVKLGHSLEEDLERLIKLRERFGDRVTIRVDANQGYSREELQVFFRGIASLDIELVEQPLRKGDLAGMRELSDEQKSLIAADESIQTYEDALALLRPVPACGIFNLKLMKSGGIYPAMQIADLARHAGIRLMWGCNDESIVSLTAALHAAFSCPNTAYLDLDGSLDLASDIATGGFILHEGKMRLGTAPGLGLTLLG